jgi:hypothetical protein
MHVIGFLPFLVRWCLQMCWSSPIVYGVITQITDQITWFLSIVPIVKWVFWMFKFPYKVALHDRMKLSQARR